MKFTVISFLRNACCAALAGTGLLFASPAHADTVNVPMVLTGTNDWYHTNTYVISHAVFVMSNALLNIEAGTIIKATNSGVNGTNVGALYITQGGKINAQGNAQNPIIFTSTKDDLSLPDDMGIWGGGARGLWGGVVIFGKAVINGATDSIGNAQPTKYEVYEGLTDIQINGQYVFRFGGTDDNDNSGVFRYVSLRHGGAVLAPNKEINGLSLGAVGRGTTVEYVETYCFADDGFEFFGGTVNTKYLVSAFNDDDSFDTDMGYSGTNQFWFSIMAPDKRSNGLELNSQLNELTTSSSPLLTPQGTFVVYNLTALGSGIGSTSVSGGTTSGGIALRAFASPRIYNAVFSDFNTTKGIFLDAANPNNVPATNCWTAGYAQIKNTLWWNFSNAGLAGSAATNNTATGLGDNTLATNWFTTAAFTNTIADPMFIGLSRTNVGAYLDPRPQAGSPSESNYATAPSGLTAANYLGAFQPGAGNWAANWTALSEYQIMGGPGYNPPASTATVTVTPNQPVLVSAKNGGNLEVVYATQTGFNYQLQSKSNLVTQVTWDDVGSPTAGTGGNVTNSVSTAAGEMFFRVKVQ
jgi:hypothetical protein